MKLLVLLIAPLPFAIGTGLRALGPKGKGKGGVEKDVICHYDQITGAFDKVHVPLNSAHFDEGKHPEDIICEKDGVLACPFEEVPGEDLFYDRECNMYSELYNVCNNELLDEFLAKTSKGAGYYCKSNDPNETPYLGRNFKGKMTLTSKPNQKRFISIDLKSVPGKSTTYWVFAVSSVLSSDSPTFIGEIVSASQNEDQDLSETFDASSLDFNVLTTLLITLDRKPKGGNDFERTRIISPLHKHQDAVSFVDVFPNI